MKIRVSVDVVEAMRRGMDCKQDAVIEIEPAALPPEVCEYITRAGKMDTCHNLGDEDVRLDNHGYYGIGSIPVPTVAGLIEHVRMCLESDAAQERERAERKEVSTQKHEENVATWLSLDDETILAASDLFPGLPNLSNDARVYPRYNQLQALRAERKLAKESQIEAEKAAAVREIADWIAAHGSPRLRACAAEGIECSAIYRDERLAAERPGWRWAQETWGTDSEPRNPPAEAFATLSEARVSVPGCKLVRWVSEEETDEEGAVTAPAWRGYLAIAEFLDREIVFGAPAELTIE